MCATHRLRASEILRPCDPESIPFETTAEAIPIEGIVGQGRATAALRFGVGISGQGYNLFAVGPPGIGKQSLIRHILAHEVPPRADAPDWCYVHDFAAPERPRVLELPCGLGVRLERAMLAAVAELRVALRAAFESEEFRTRRQALVNALKERQEAALAAIHESAKARDVAVVHTDTGIMVAPLRGGEPIDAEIFNGLPKEAQEKAQAEMTLVKADLQGMLRNFHDWGREHQQALQALQLEVAAQAAHRVIDGVRAGFAECPGVLDYLSQVETDVVANVDLFLEAAPEGLEGTLRHMLGRNQGEGQPLRRYQVNVLVDGTRRTGPPAVEEDNPTHANLVGRIDHETRFGALVTDHTLIRAGAFHRAAGGYLIVDALRVLQSPYAWEAVKRTLRSGQIRIEGLATALGLTATTSLEPAPVPLGRTKVILTGERSLYALLAALDPDFPELFKVLVDFEEEMGRDAEAQALYARLVATLVRKEELRPFDRGAVARVIDESARTVGDAEKVTLQLRSVADLLREADDEARRAAHDVVGAEDVQAAIEAARHRTNRVSERLLEGVARGDLAVSTGGEQVGQVNGLAVFQLGGRLFGHPTRITARVRVGAGTVLDIEREVALGGPIHSKGVLILAGLLGARYACDLPLALSATLVFEQSYGTIEGDSASMAELCALLSALAEIPVKQSLALTGSVDQMGRAQSVGGVNEKIEGFFDVCKLGGLTGEQGVLLPRSNAKNLMLRRDVVEAVAASRFHVHVIEDLDDALEALTGVPAGRRGASGHFPAGTVNGQVESRLVKFAREARKFAHASGGRRSHRPVGGVPVVSEPKR